METKTNLQKALFNIRYGYILVFALFTVLNKFIPFVGHVGDTISTLVYNSLAIFGALLLAVDFFTRRNMFRIRYNWLLLAFFGVYILSMVYNIRFGWADNAKTLVWMLIQTFMLMAADPDQPVEAHQKPLNIIFNGYIIVWFTGVAVSLWQFVVQYYAPHIAASGDSTPEGFLDGRLYGVFTDPNVAAVCSVIAALLAVYLLKVTCRRPFVKLCYWITIVFNLIYVVLSGSRTGELILIGIAVAAAVFIGISKIYAAGTKWFVKITQRLLLVALSLVIVVGGIKVLKVGLPYVPQIYSRIESVFQSPSESDPSDDPSNPDDSLDPDDGPINLERPDVVGSDDISNARFKIWADALKLFQKSPLLGTSARNHLAFAENYFGEEMYMVQRGYSVHNGYLSLLTHTGLLGAGVMALWMGCVVAYILSYLIRRRKARDAHYKAIVCMALVLLAVAISAFPMMGIFFGNSIIEVLFWLIMGYTLYLVRVSDQKNSDKEPVLYRISESIVSKFKRKG